MMDMLYSASADSFFNNEDSNRTNVRCCSHDIKRMRICILYIILQLLAAVVPTLASLTPELYWKSKLPRTTLMPKSFVDRLQPPPGEQDLISRSFRYGRRCFPSCSETEPQDNPNPSAFFFLEKDLKFGHKMKFPFEKTSNQTSFLPRQVVKSIPFSSTKMAEIFNKFSVKPGSIEAKVLKSTIKECEEPGIKGEDKYCATSLESMLDFTTLKLGKHVEAFSTEEMKKKNETKKWQEYRIMPEVKKVGEENLVICHNLSYVYTVFYCHKIKKTVAYTVSLQGADGSEVKAVSVCHRDTSEWNPNHLAFQMLKVKPGSVPICHFLSQDSIAWVPKQN